MPASSSDAISSIETYFVAATTVTRGPTSARSRSSRVRIVSDDETDDTLGTAHRPLPAVREELLGIAARAEVDPLDAVDAGAAEGALGRRPEVEDPVARQVRVEPLRHLGADLVAARADRRADGGGESPAAERPDGLGGDP